MMAEIDPTQPKEVTEGDSTLVNHALPDQIAADKYNRAQKAAKHPFRCLRMARIIPPGTV
jgi:hypothetical protein